MNALKIKLMNGLYVNPQGNFDMPKALESGQEYIPVNLYIENISKSLYKTIVSNKASLLQEENFKFINMVYSTDIVSLNKLLTFMMDEIENSEIDSKTMLDLLTLMLDMINACFDMNLYDVRLMEDNISIKKKTK